MVFKNLTPNQILMLVIGLILVCWFIVWLCKKFKTQKYVPIKTPPTINKSLPLNIIDDNSKKNQQLKKETPFVVYYFYNPSCPACTHFFPSWNKVVNKLKNAPELTFQEVDITKPENENLAFYYNIKKTPTVILVTSQKDIEYSGDRSPDDLYNFILINMNEYPN
jgi:thiol-disulfide isomerase/thioredoxin